MMTGGGAVGARIADRIVLRLYIAGETPKSQVALANLREICETHLADRHENEVNDLLERPELARTDEIIAIPTLVRKLPAPILKVIGDLSDVHRVLLGLQLCPRGVPNHSVGG